MNRLKLIFRLSVFFFTFSNPLIAQIRLPALVTDSMVIQRDTKLSIWGWAASGENINVRFNGKNYKTKTGPDGKWQVWIQPTKAGGPYTMEIAGKNDKITISNILSGDVWVCAGQSNMVHYLALHQERYEKEIAEANYPEIRQFLIPTSTSLAGPNEDLPVSHWKSATQEDVLRFSVVAYFFAKKLYDEYRIPIGLINASVGGTPIEGWTSEAGLKDFPDLLSIVQQNKDTAYVNSTNRAAQEDMRRINRKEVTDLGLTGPIAWYDTAYPPLNWKTINIPGYWEDQGVRELDGVIWYRREIDVPAAMADLPAKVAMGRIVDADEFYINGIKIGNTTYQYPQRRYTVPEGVLKPGKNLFVVRVTNQSGKGGFVPDKPYFLTADGQTIDLKGYWQYKVGEVFSFDPNVRRGISNQNQPTALYNAMIAPMTNYAIKGVLWYQGESNAGNPEAYRQLLPAFVQDWRNQWALGDLPFLIVQLPNFMEVSYSPSESNWALMREAQSDVLKIPNTGLAVAIDLGEWNDIHPGNKKPIGDRLALAAQKIAYGNNEVVYSGPIFKSSRFEGDKIFLTFDHTGSGLVSGNGEALHHFAIAGADKKFRWGKAKIVDNTVVVSHADIPNPVYIRYAWADNPDFANLYNKEGLPASPFRTDK
jgi:sialate O-acetylesterase